MAVVTLENVSKSYPGGVQAVEKFCLNVKDGEFIVLVGPSGCGKSTVLRMIAGLEEITAGTVRIGDKTVNEIPPKDRDIAMVFQNYALYPHMSVYENMAFGLKLRRLPRAEINSRIDEASRILGLDPYLKRKPGALSGGQRQRVAVGRAIVRQPAAFLFDEPLSNLDAKLRVKMRVEISQLHSRLKATMIYVTHDQVEAMTMGDRIVVMNEGSIQQIDSPVALYDNPANRFVAGFIGTPPMNFFEGKIAKADGHMIFESADGFSVPIPETKMTLLNNYLNKPVTLGLRPEDVKSSQDPQFKDLPVINARVEVVEPMGSETCVYFRKGNTTFISRVDSHLSYRVGTEDTPALRMTKARFFDSDTGNVI